MKINEKIDLLKELISSVEEIEHKLYLQEELFGLLSELLNHFKKRFKEESIKYVNLETFNYTRMNEEFDYSVNDIAGTVASKKNFIMSIIDSLEKEEDVFMGESTYYGERYYTEHYNEVFAKLTYFNKCIIQTSKEIDELAIEIAYNFNERYVLFHSSELDKFK